MATTNLKLVSKSPETGSRQGTPRPITTYYFAPNQRHPTRIARSTTPTAAACAVLRRIGEGEDISVADIIGPNGRLLRTIKVSHEKVVISG